MRPTRAEKLPWRKIDGRAVIVHPSSGKVHELDPVGALLWELADGSSTLPRIGERVAEEFEVDAAAAERDAGEFYAELERLNLIRWNAAAEGESLAADPR